MERTINGIKVEYLNQGAPVKISGSGTFKGLDLFELYTLLRAIYNNRNLARKRDEETEILHKIKMPNEKESERLT